MKIKKDITKETFVLLGILIAYFSYMIHIMGVSNMFNTMMNTAHDLIINTVLYIMGIAVLSGAMGSFLSEFGIIALINKIISPVMRPLYRLPGASALCVMTTFLSDNPAVIALADDEGFRKYFARHELPCLCNLGTAFGMGLVVWTFMSSVGHGFMKAASIGLLGAVVGSIISVRLMSYFTKKHFGDTSIKSPSSKALTTRRIRPGSYFQRGLDALLEGGKNGVDMGISIIPGVVIICTLVMMLTYEAPVGGYTGGAYEGVGLLPKVGAYLMPVLKPLLGFQSAQAIAFPITALGAVGAAISMVPKLLAEGHINANDIAVFTALGMCWSGYLSTHIAMMDALNESELAPKAILSHTIGGLCAGISAHFLFLLFT
ncbi:MAG: hypothetical protein Q4P28_03675 [Tissierellia bacterium]|nr:hypothetical protein [Tissierellia bacterium]